MIPEHFWPFAVLAVMAACLAAVLPASADAARPTLTPVGVSAFGQSSFVLTLPHGAKVPADATLTENGAQVPEVTVTPAASVPGSYGVALLLDAGSRRAGRSIQGQLAAARAFVEQLPEGLPVALLTYNSAATVAVPFSTGRAPLENALKQPPPLGRGSRVVDAVGAAVDLFAAERLGGGAVVALAGDADDGSSAPAGAVRKRAMKRGVWIFGASLAGGRRSPAATLDALVADGVGQNLGRMSGPGLVALLTGLGRQAGGASVLSYPVQAAPGDRATVEFQGGGRDVRTLVTIPASITPQAAGAVRDEERSAFDALAGQPAGRLAVSLAAAVLLFLAFRPMLTGIRRRSEVRDRVSSYTGGVAAGEPGVTGAGASVGPQLPDGTQPVLRGERMERLSETLELARIGVSAQRLVVQTALGALLVGYLVAAISGIPLAGVLGVGVVVLVVRTVVRFKLARERKAFADQLADALQAAAGAMRAGHSFVGAIATIVGECGEPASTEFRRVVSCERMGVPLDLAFADMVRRMDNRDVQQVALVAVLQRETGGNAAEALDRVVENLRGRDDVRRLVGTLTAQGRASRWVLTALPVGLALMLTMMSAEYMAPLYESTLGRVMLVVAGCMCAMGSVAIGKIVDIEV